MGSGKPTAARRPTVASHHTLWVVASQQRPEGRLRQAIIPYGRWQANSGPKANCGKPSHPMGSGKPTVARRPTVASHHTLWAVASQQWPEGQLWQANTPYGQRQANSGPKANCGKPTCLWAAASQQRPEGQLRQANTNPIHTCMHTHIHAINYEHVAAS